MSISIDPLTVLYNTIDLAEEALHAIARKGRYAVSRWRPKNDKKGNLRKRSYRCSRGRKYTPVRSSSRNTGTRMCECEYAADVTRIQMGFGIQWKLSITQPLHNHPLQVDAYSHPGYRRRDSATLKVINSLQDSNFTPKDIHNHLVKENPEALFTRQDIRNDVARMRRQQLGDLTPTQAVLVALEQYNGEAESDNQKYSYWRSTDDQGHLDYLFFVHPSSKEMLRLHPDLILIDTTYRTNRYNMPLAHITGRTSQNGSFCIGYAFMTAERTEHYAQLVKNLTELWRDELNLPPPSAAITDKESALKRKRNGRSFRIARMGLDRVGRGYSIALRIGMAYGSASRTTIVMRQASSHTSLVHGYPARSRCLISFFRRLSTTASRPHLLMKARTLS